MTNDGKRQVAIVVCSGIGKAFGSVARDAGYELCDELRPNTTRLVALAKLVLGEEQALEQVRQNPTITIDGCKLMCAATLAKHSGATIARQAAVLDAFRQHAQLKPEGIAELNAQGKQLARIMAEDLAQVVDSLGSNASNGDAPGGGPHA